LNDAARELAIGGVVPPEPVDRERLYVNALLIHQLKTLRSENLVPPASPGFRKRRPFDDVRHVDHAVAMDVDDLDAAAADRDFAPFSLSAHSDENGTDGHSSARSRDRPDEMPSIHVVLTAA
jgi:hypothetical protein